MKTIYFTLCYVVLVNNVFGYLSKPPDDKTKCPVVRAMRHFDLKMLLGKWYVVQYYASSEEALSYKCMRADFTEESKILSNNSPQMEVTMNFTYVFINDPLTEQLLGNITWQVPDYNTPAHWVHAEDTYEGIYNTYVLDTDYTSWTLLMHCAEKEKSPRYLSAFIMSRGKDIGHNVVSYLRDKLPRYDIDLNYMFEMSQSGCDLDPLNAAFGVGKVPPLVRLAMATRKRNARRRHPLKRVHRHVESVNASNSNPVEESLEERSSNQLDYNF